MGSARAELKAVLGVDISGMYHNDQASKQAAADAHDLDIFQLSGDRLAVVRALPTWTASDVIKNLPTSEGLAITHLVLKGVAGSTVWNTCTVGDVIVHGLSVHAIAASVASEHVRAAYAYILNHAFNGPRSVAEKSFTAALAETAANHVTSLDLVELTLDTISGRSLWAGGVKGGRRHGFGFESSYTQVFMEMDNRDLTTTTWTWAVYNNGALVWEKEFHRASSMFHS